MDANESKSKSYNFDNESNIINNKIPSVKVISKFNEKGSAGLWIAYDNMLNCKCKKNCKESCDDNCTEHFIGTKEHVQTTHEEIHGGAIIGPRICILRRTNLIKLNIKGEFEGLWKKGDGNITDENGNKKYTYAKRYLLVFLDTENKPLHEEAIQLTAKGTFQIDFDKNYMNFRKEFLNAYNKALGKFTAI